MVDTYDCMHLAIVAYTWRCFFLYYNRYIQMWISYVYVVNIIKRKYETTYFIIEWWRNAVVVIKY